MDHPFPVLLLVNTPSGLAPLTAERARLHLPHGLDPGESPLSYGPYLEAIAVFLAKDSYSALRTALSGHLLRPVSLNEIRKLEIISEKHGAIYNVARVRASLTGGDCSLAVNLAIRPDQHSVLEEEFSLLHELHTRYGPQLLPHPYLPGEASCEGNTGARLPLKLFIAEWFDDYHEFHLSPNTAGGSPAVKVWDLEKGDWLLTASQTRSLYRRAAEIMTFCLDDRTFRQIYPWHHAAGDFILHRRGDEVDVRLVTARGYRCLLPDGFDPENMWLAIVHFFLNLTIRMRLDRFDGTGEMAWAGSECIRDVAAGFLHAWDKKVERGEALPPTGETLQLLRSFTPHEWLPLAELVASDGAVEADEVELILARLEEHVSSLASVLDGGDF